MLLGTLVWLTVTASASAQLDYGDAPDGTDAGYSTPTPATFPSLDASDGPRHTNGGLRLGPFWDAEADSEQVDNDGADEDGVVVDSLVDCGESQATVFVDARGVAPDVLATDDIYVNAWVDWNADGDWLDATDCAGGDLEDQFGEWAVVNEQIPVAELGDDGVAAVPIGFRAGPLPEQAWVRVTLTRGALNPLDPGARSGGASPGPYPLGETEDYLKATLPDPPDIEFEKKKKKKKKKKGKGKFTVSCDPNPLGVLHGKSGKFNFRVVDMGKGLIFGKRVGKTKGKTYNSKLIRSKDQKGVPKGFFRASGLRVKSTNVHQKLFPIEVRTFKFKFTRGKGKKRHTQTLTCVALIFHKDFNPPRKNEKPPPPPGGDNPDDPPASNPRCNDGQDNDADAQVDGNDPGCLAGPNGAYDPLDQSEEDVFQGIDCNQFVNVQIVSLHLGDTPVGHLLRGSAGDPFGRQLGDPDFEQGGPVQVPGLACGDPADNTLVGWQVDRFNDLIRVIYFVEAQPVGTGEKILSVAANTR